MRAIRFAGEPEPTSSNRLSRYLTVLALQAIDVLAVIRGALMAHSTYELLRARGIPHGEALERALELPRAVSRARATNDEMSEDLR